MKKQKEENWLVEEIMTLCQPHISTLATMEQKRVVCLVEKALNELDALADQWNQKREGREPNIKSLPWWVKMMGKDEGGGPTLENKVAFIIHNCITSKGRLSEALEFDLDGPKLKEALPMYLEAFQHYTASQMKAALGVKLTPQTVAEAAEAKPVEHDTVNGFAVTCQIQLRNNGLGTYVLEAHTQLLDNTMPYLFRYTSNLKGAE